MRLLFSYSHLKMKTKKQKHFLACGLYRTFQQAGFGLWAFVYPTLPKYLKRYFKVFSGCCAKNRLKWG